MIVYIQWLMRFPSECPIAAASYLQVSVPSGIEIRVAARQNRLAANLSTLPALKAQKMKNQRKNLMSC